MDSSPILLSFDAGTLVVSGRPAEQLLALPGVQHDPRSDNYRAEALHYRLIVEHLRRKKIEYQDEARAFQPTLWQLRTSRDPFPHQTEGLETWIQKGSKGVVVLPTGT